MDGSILANDGQLNYYTSKDMVFVAATSLGRFKLFRLNFGRDGSIYVPFPYLETKRGSLAVVDAPDASGPRTIDLKGSGITVDCDVKFSHHTSGIVQFSKTGGPELLPRRNSFRLDGPIGKLFELNVYWLHGFKHLGGSKDFVVPFQFLGQHPTSLRVSAEWLRKRDILENAGSGTGPIGPETVVVDRRSGAVRRSILVGQPAHTPLQDHVMMLSSEQVMHAQGADSPTMVFLGGWDFHEGRPPSSVSSRRTPSCVKRLQARQRRDGRISSSVAQAPGRAGA